MTDDGAVYPKLYEYDVSSGTVEKQSDISEVNGNWSKYTINFSGWHDAYITDADLTTKTAKKWKVCFYDLAAGDTYNKVNVKPVLNEIIRWTKYCLKEFHFLLFVIFFI